MNKAEDHFVIAPFLFPDADGIMVEMNSSKTLHLEELSQGGLQDFHLAPSENSQLPDYVQLVKKGIEHINKGAFSKVVLSRKKEIAIDSTKAIKIYAELYKKYPDAFVYLLTSPLFGTWIGASPELLLSKSGDKNKTVSLAGTKKINEEGWGAKEIEEQDIITRFILENLASEAQNIHVSALGTASIGPISHIKKEISFEHNGSPKTIIDILHPTPAVCGMPTGFSKEFILNNEGYNRSLYTGFLGPVKSNRDLQLFVNLRCMQVFQNKAQLYLGAGITKESEANKEFEETESKSKVLLNVLI